LKKEQRGDSVERYYVADGYFPNGESRPKREVSVVKVGEKTTLVRYIDDGTEIHVFHKSIMRVCNG
jgi:hypothetical protein